MSGFQTHINQQPAPGVEGDWASNNPFASAVQPIAGGYRVAAGQSVRCGYFAWGAADGLVYSSLAAAVAIGGALMGFVCRQANEPSVVITTFLGESRMTLQDGMPCTLLEVGDFYVQLPGAAAGSAVFALEATGAPSLVDDGTTSPTGFVAVSQAKVNAVSNAAAGVTIAAQTGIMTVVGANASGLIEAGQRITGAGVPANTYVTAQLTGAAGGVGTYQTNSLNRAAVAAFIGTFIQGGLAKISKPI